MPGRVKTAGLNDAGALMIHLVGGANVPTGSMRVNATCPFGLLEVYEHAVRVVVRPRLFGALPLVASPADLEAIYPVRGIFGTKGIGLRLRDGREWYFWTRQGHQPLAAMASVGFPVSWDVRKAVKVWRARP
jgi:hypothetical protein